MMHQAPQEIPPADPQLRHYRVSECVVFYKTREAYGGLSNMAAGFPLRVNEVFIRTSEALYQACRFPHLPRVQAEIIEQRSPMSAKMKGKPHRANSRPDWEDVRVPIMRWCLRVKLAQNWNKFRDLLEETGERPIVEKSLKDPFWGAQPVDQMLIGQNVLGRLLMELRELVHDADRQSWMEVPPPKINDFLLYKKQIEPISAKFQDIHDPHSKPLQSPYPRAEAPEVEAIPQPLRSASQSAGQPLLFGSRDKLGRTSEKVSSPPWGSTHDTIPPAPKNDPIDEMQALLVRLISSSDRFKDINSQDGMETTIDDLALEVAERLKNMEVSKFLAKKWLKILVREGKLIKVGNSKPSRYRTDSTLRS